MGTFLCQNNYTIMCDNKKEKVKMEDKEEEYLIYKDNKGNCNGSWSSIHRLCDLSQEFSEEFWSKYLPINNTSLSPELFKNEGSSKQLEEIKVFLGDYSAFASFEEGSVKKDTFIKLLKNTVRGLEIKLYKEGVIRTVTHPEVFRAFNSHTNKGRTYNVITKGNSVYFVMAYIKNVDNNS